MPGAIMGYKKKLSGPLLDRIDLHIMVPPVDKDRLIDARESESSREVRLRVIGARKKQTQRFRELSISANGQMRPADIKKFCSLETDAVELLKEAISRFSLSARSYFKIIKIAQTISDLNQESKITKNAVAEALQYRAIET